MKVVLDTVVIVRALMNPVGIWGRVIARSQTEFTIILSPELVLEAERVVATPAVARKLRRIDPAPASKRLQVILEQGERVSISGRRTVCRDPNDDKLFECAVDGGAAYIISEDLDVLAIAEYKGVRTVTAAQFLEILDQS